jgi:hypothetical protein
VEEKFGSADNIHIILQIIYTYNLTYAGRWVSKFCFEGKGLRLREAPEEGRLSVGEALASEPDLEPLDVDIDAAADPVDTSSKAVGVTVKQKPPQFASCQPGCFSDKLAYGAQVAMINLLNLWSHWGLHALEKYTENRLDMRGKDKGQFTPAQAR